MKKMIIRLQTYKLYFVKYYYEYNKCNDIWSILNRFINKNSGSHNEPEFLFINHISLL